MGLGSDAGEKAAEILTDKTVPEIEAGAHSILDRLSGATVTLKWNPPRLELYIPPRKQP
jgi:hypothetical protein